MAGLIVVASDIPGVEDIRAIFQVFGYTVAVRGYWEAILLGNPRAVLLAMYNREIRADRRAADLREAGYDGVLMVLGRIAPDLEVRRKLAEQKVWFMPAISGPGDVVARVRQLL
ncbi:MAG: hypothetical protein FWG74_06895 [Planctomycetes bacterium]|nr:hypothetical protein [Planctomycetota bacterium]